MRIRFIKPWMAYQPNQEIDTPFAGAAELLIRRGVAVDVATPSPPVDQAKGAKQRPR